LTGERVPASCAAEIGLVNHAVPDAELDARVDAFADRLAAGAQSALRYTKVAINVGLRQLAAAIMDTSLGYEALTARDSAYREAVQAFLARRKPRDTG